MKKVLLTILVISCAVALFATDISVALKLSPVFDKNGVRIDFGSFWTDYSISGEKAGASALLAYNFAPKNQKSGFGLGTSMWLKPNDNDKKYTFGFQTQFAGVTGLVPSETYCFAKFNDSNSHEKGKYVGKPKNAVELEVGTVVTPDFDYKNSKYYVSGEFDFLYTKIKDCLIGHFDSKSLVKLNNGKPEVQMAFAELSYSPNCLYRMYKSDVNFEGNQYGFNSYDGSILGDCMPADYNDSGIKYLTDTGKLFRAAVTYQYSFLNKAEDNGFFASVWAKDIPVEGKFENNNNEGTSISLKATVGAKKFSSEFGFHFRGETGEPNEGLNVASLAKFDLLYLNKGEFQLTVPYAITELYKEYTDPTPFGNYRAYAEYVNSRYDVDKNGVFLTAETSGSIGSCGMDLKFHAGFDQNGLKDDYKVSSNFSVHW